MSTDVHIRPLEEREIDEADRIMRLAFGTFLKMPDPMQMFGDATFTKRWYSDPAGALAAEADGRLIGSNFAAHWRNSGFFGAPPILSELWERRLAQRIHNHTQPLFLKPCTPRPPPPPSPPTPH